ncbi:hypothetical protein GCM10023085_20390 [Actinomadura viridis]|uniref:Uncharacterized protein n=1 Tax=Actinomadura viridis TaxID=58110 RepID=A0A931DDR4_9ACTN|nr:hypothetical protein [Actinomadura viridis]MBG6089204.1 hypothetical protein [Actinomadura viridis]
MDRHDLQAALTRAGLREYEIEGVHEPAWRPGELPYLRREGERWAVGVRERGEYGTIRRFTGEDEACRFFYDLVTSATPPPPPGGPPAVEEPGLIRRLGRWRRVAWQEYRRARRARGPEGGEPPPP